MSEANLRALQKSCLLVLFQLVIILLAFTFLSASNIFQKIYQPQLNCIDLSQLNQLCLSIFECSPQIMPHNKGIQISSIQGYPFKILTFEQQTQRLRNVFKNSQNQLFHLVEYDYQPTSTDQIRMATDIPPIAEFLAYQKATFINTLYKFKILDHKFKYVVTYFYLPKGIQIKPQVNIKYPTLNSVLFNNKLIMIQCALGIIGVLLWALWGYSKSKDLNSFKQTFDTGKLNRTIQFLLNFGMNNLIFFLTINKFWETFNLQFINELLGFQKSLVPMTQLNVYQSYVNLFPEWLLLSYFFYQIFERYFEMSSLKLILLSGYFGAVLFILPFSYWQFIAQFVIVLIGFFFGALTRYNSNNRLTISFVSTGFNLILMILIKNLWYLLYSENNDFALRFQYNQIFILTNILGLFFQEQKTMARSTKKYIPSDQNSFDQDQNFKELESVPSAQKI